MQEIPPWFWMIIISGLSGLFGLILFYVAMLLKESMMTIREFRYMLVEVHDIIDSAKIAIEKGQRIIDMISSTVETISDSVLKPIAAVSTFFLGAKNIVSRYMGTSDKASAE